MARYLVSEHGDFIQIPEIDSPADADFSDYDFPEIDEEKKKYFAELKSVIKNVEEKETEIHKLKMGEIERFYRQYLNSAQADAVFSLQGPSLVIAGAGS